MSKSILLWGLLIVSVFASPFVIGNAVAEYELENTIEVTMDSVIINKYSDTQLVYVKYPTYRTVYYVECLGKVDGPGIYFQVSGGTYYNVDVGDPLKLAVLYKDGKLYDVRLVEKNGNVASCLNPIR